MPSAALVAAAAALLLVGVVSHTPIRHAIQVTPLLVLLAANLARRTWAPWGALVVCAFWLLIMALIWLFLLGIAHVITGQFSRAEVVLTVILGVASAAGVVAALRVPERPRWMVRIAALVLAAALQVGAMWMSLRPMFEAR